MSYIGLRVVDSIVAFEPIDFHREWALLFRIAGFGVQMGVAFIYKVTNCSGLEV